MAVIAMVLGIFSVDVFEVSAGALDSCLGGLTTANRQSCDGYSEANFGMTWQTHFESRS